jgi:hypothetical protein
MERISSGKSFLKRDEKGALQALVVVFVFGRGSSTVVFGDGTLA